MWTLKSFRTYNWPGQSDQQRSIYVKPCDVSICVGLSLNWTLNPQPLPEVLLLAGPALTLTPHSQIHTWISVVSVTKKSMVKSLLPCPGTPSSSHFLSQLWVFLTLSLYLSLPHYFYILFLYGFLCPFIPFKSLYKCVFPSQTTPSLQLSFFFSSPSLF